MTGRDDKQIRVLVVDDSAFIRRAVIKIFEDHPDIRVIDVASDGEMAIELIKKHRPDVVTLDVKMPVLDGLAALKRIMAECPTPVIMLSSLTEKGGENTLRALELGAVDFIDKSTAGGPMDLSGLARELTAKVTMAARVDLQKLRKSDEPVPVSAGQATPPRNATELVLIGSSTGGPPALQAILAALPATFPCPILIVQHMPVGFTASLAERLNRLCAIRVKEAEDGEPLLPATAYLARGGLHLKVRRVGRALHASVDPYPAGTLHCPSIDVLLESAARTVDSNLLAVVLTGMGKDGADGARVIKECGGRVIVESEETAIVFGMPKAVGEAVRVDRSVPLYAMSETILAML